MNSAVSRLALLSVSAILFATPAFGASFDCTKATTRNEKAICADPRLSRADEEMARAYEAARQSSPSSQSLARSHAGWLRQLQSCNNDECLLKGYGRRIEELHGAAAAFGATGTCIPISHVPVYWQNWAPLGCVSPIEVPKYLSQRLFLRMDDEDEHFMGEGTRTRTCSEYFEALADGLAAETTTDMNVESDFRVACGALLAIQKAKPAKHSSLPKGILKDLAAIPVAVLPSLRDEDQEEINRDARKGRTLSDYVKSRKVIVGRSPPETLSFTYDKGWQMWMGVISVADFDGDGADDALVMVMSAAEMGSLGSWDVWLMTRPSVSSRTVRLFQLEVKSVREKKGRVTISTRWKQVP